MKNLSITNETSISYADFNVSQIGLRPNMSLYFYSRTDWAHILASLSPWRPHVEKFFPSLHYSGLVANSICILIFSKFIRRKNILRLTLLALANLLYNLMSVLPHFLQITHIYERNIYTISNVSCFMHDFAKKASHFYAVLITLLITIERFTQISKLELKFSNPHANICFIIGLALIPLVAALPHGFLMVFNEKNRQCEIRACFRRRVQDSSLTYYQLYFAFTEPIFVWVLPGVLITCMNFYVVLSIFSASEVYAQKFNLKFKMFNFFRDHEAISHAKLTEYKAQVTSTALLVRRFKSDWLRGLRSSPSIVSVTIKSNKDATSVKDTMSNKDAISIKDATSYKDVMSTKEMSCSNCTVNMPFIDEEEPKKSKLARVCECSHYLTVLMVGFFFLFSTVPYGIVVSLQNNLAFQLNYALGSMSEYLRDPAWIRFGHLRERAILFKVLFMSNHCFNLFIYLIFNRHFRNIICEYFPKFGST